MLAALAVTLAMLLVPSASADTYTDQLVNRFDAETHVVVDPGPDRRCRTPTS